MSVTYCGTHYQTIALAALTYAELALPDLTVIDADEDPAVVADSLESHWFGEATRAGEFLLPDEDGETVQIERWRGLCRGAIVARIEAHREGRRARGADVVCAEAQP